MFTDRVASVSAGPIVCPTDLCFWSCWLKSSHVYLPGHPKAVETICKMEFARKVHISYYGGWDVFFKWKTILGHCFQCFMDAALYLLYFLFSLRIIQVYRKWKLWINSHLRALTTQLFILGLSNSNIVMRNGQRRETGKKTHHAHFYLNQEESCALWNGHTESKAQLHKHHLVGLHELCLDRMN